MKTVVIKPQRITKYSHEAIKKKSQKEMCDQQVVIRKILNDWALNQDRKQS